MAGYELSKKRGKLNMAKDFAPLVFCLIFAFSMMTGSFVMYPQYKVWSSRLAGEAEFVHAQSNRKIKVLEAQAAEEAAKALAQAEITRAQGVAEANKIIGDSLTGNEGYLRYLWIQGLQTNQMQVIYVPTEANLPLLESTRGVQSTASISSHDALSCKPQS